MRRDDDVVAAEERMVGERLGGEDVERRAAQLAGLEAGRQGVEVDQLAAGAVDQPRPVLHRGDRPGVDQVDGVRRLRHVQGDDVGAAEQVLELLGALDPQFAEALGGDELVEGDDLHLEGLGALGDELADAAEADHAERLAVELGALELGPLPGAAGQRGVRARRRCGRARASAPACARRRRRSSIRARWRRRCRGGSRRGCRRCRRPCRRGRSPSAARRARSAPASPGSPSGRAARRTRRSRRSAPARSSPGRGRRRSSGAAARRPSRRSSRAPGSSPGHLGRVLDRPVDAGRERFDVGRLDRREHADAQLVAPQLAVGLDVDDAVGAQGRGEGGGVDLLGEVDRADDQRALRRVGDERRREIGLLGPAVEVPGGGARCGPRTSRGRRRPASTRSGRRAAAGSPARACCRSGSCASSRPPCAARGRRAASARRRRRARRSARSRPG